jgi:hypothetical protein
LRQFEREVLSGLICGQGLTIGGGQVERAAIATFIGEGCDAEGARPLPGGALRIAGADPESAGVDAGAEGLLFLLRGAA